METPAFGSGAHGRAAAANIHASSAERQGTAKPCGETKGGAEGIESIEADGRGIIHTVRIIPTVESYLHELDRVCIKAAGNPQVRPLLFALLLRAPRTAAGLRHERKRNRDFDGLTPSFRRIPKSRPDPKF